MKKFWIFVIVIMAVVTTTGCGNQPSVEDHLDALYNVSYDDIEGKAVYSDDDMIITVIFAGENPTDDWWNVRRHVRQEDGRWHISEQWCVESHIETAVEEYRTFTNSFD